MLNIAIVEWGTKAKMLSHCIMVQPHDDATLRGMWHYTISIIYSINGKLLATLDGVANEFC